MDTELDIKKLGGNSAVKVHINLGKKINSLQIMYDLAQTMKVLSDEKNLNPF